MWPLLIGLAVLVARRLGVRMGASLGVALGSVVALSFAFSVARTASDPAAAYFITPTRIWELGVGGLLALAEPRFRVLGGRVWHVFRRVGSWTGIAMIAATGLLYSAATPFPGYQAGLPVLGALLVLLCAPLATERGTPGRSSHCARCSGWVTCPTRSTCGTGR